MCRMIAGGNWWRANEIVIRYHIRQTDPRDGSCDKTTQRSSRQQKWVPTFDLSDRALSRQEQIGAGFVATIAVDDG